MIWMTTGIITRVRRISDARISAVVTTTDTVPVANSTMKDGRTIAAGDLVNARITTTTNHATRTMAAAASVFVRKTDAVLFTIAETIHPRAGKIAITSMVRNVRVY